MCTGGIQPVSKSWGSSVVHTGWNRLQSASLQSSLWLRSTRLGHFVYIQPVSISCHWSLNLLRAFCWVEQLSGKTSCEIVQWISCCLWLLHFLEINENMCVSFFRPHHMNVDSPYYYWLSSMVCQLVCRLVCLSRLSAVQKWLNRSRCPRSHVLCGVQCALRRNLADTIEPSMLSSPAKMAEPIEMQFWVWA